MIAFNRKIGCLLSICDYSVIVDQGDWSRCYEEQCIIGKLVYGVFNYNSITDSYEVLINERGQNKAELKSLIKFSTSKILSGSQEMRTDAHKGIQLQSLKGCNTNSL